MSDFQMFTLALAIVIPISLLLDSNSRITEAKETLRAEMKTMTAGISLGFARVSNDIQSLRADLKIHQVEHHHR